MIKVDNYNSYLKRYAKDNKCCDIVVGVTKQKTEALNGLSNLEINEFTALNIETAHNVLDTLIKEIVENIELAIHNGKTTIEGSRLVVINTNADTFNSIQTSNAFTRICGLCRSYCRLLFVVSEDTNLRSVNHNDFVHVIAA